MRRDSARRRAVRGVSLAVASSLVLPLAACSLGTASGVGLVHAGCPADIRIATGALPHVEWGFLYGLLDADALEIDEASVSAPLLLDGEPSGATLTILVDAEVDGARPNIALHDDPTILLGAVDTDVAILDAVRYPTVGVFAPLLRDPRMLYWDATAYPGATTIEALGRARTPDGTALVPVIGSPTDPYLDYAIGNAVLSVDQIVTDRELGIPTFLEAGGIAAQTGSALVDGYLLGLPTGSPNPVTTRLIDDGGYSRDAGVLSATPQHLVRYSDCLHVLVPALQRALVAYLDDPEETTQLLVRLAAEFGDETYDAELAATALATLDDERLTGNGLDGTIGDIDLGRVRDLFEKAIPAWREAGVTVPRGVEPDDVVTNAFIDRAIGL
jgi:hypothetical protein